MTRRFALSLVLAAGLAPAVALAADSPATGIEVSDIDRAADPCDDFFQFANGAWRAANPIPAEMNRWSRRWAAGEASKDRLHQILDETVKVKDAPRGSTEQLIGDFYGACMDEATVNRRGVEPLKPLLGEIDKIESRGELEAMIGKLHAVAINVPFGVASGSDNHNPVDVLAQIYASGLGLPDRDYYLKTEDRFVEARAKYREHVAAMLKLGGVAEAEGAKQAESIFNFEKALAEASLDNVALRDPKATDHKMSFAELAKLTPHFDWQGYARSAPLPQSDVNVLEPAFMRQVDRMLESTPIADWRTYLKWKAIAAAADSLSDDFVRESFAFNGAYLSGAKEMKPRWKRCVEQTDGLLGEALGKKYVEIYFPPEAKARMTELVANLQTAMGEIIRDLDWMSDVTKKKALEKLSTFNPKVGYPDKWKDYSQVAISRGSYWENVVAGIRFNVQDDLAQIGKPVDRGRWGMTPPTSNAYYNPLLNEIVFPAGILQPPAFGVTATDAMNYGGIGVVIGHEISHGYDDQGAQYDAQGRLKNWWTDEDLRKFEERGACVVDQFENYFVEPGLHHNGKLVLGESIGDLAGARIAYRAFQIAQKGKPPAPTVGGYTPDQQFFIAWGQFRGDAVRPETARLMVQGDPHPIGKYRVIGPLSNLPEFQQAFSCKPGSAMVRPPEKRCDVW